MKKIFFSAWSLLLCACLLFSKPTTIQETDFEFTLPIGWKTMGQIWDDYSPKQDYKKLGVNEIITVTNFEKKEQKGIWFTVAGKDYDGGDLREELERVYSQTTPAIPQYTITQIEWKGYPTFVVKYRRPSGEPWWEFQDYWLVKDGQVYLLSFEALQLEEYAEEMQMILDSFVWK